MTYEYHCKSCDTYFDMKFPIGEALSEVKCPSCEKLSCRCFRSCSFILTGGGWPSKSARLKKEMTDRNNKAGERMRKNHDSPVKTVAYDYGNGDIREK